jgi:predicted Co/Zn/Cd cation transporter (cation efflux family)
MNDRTEQKERPYLLLAAAGNLTIGCVGLVVSVISSSQAILLDGLFNLTYFIVGLFTLKVARLVQKGDDERFPYGYAFFEPLVNTAISAAVLVAFAVMHLIRDTGLDFLVPYVDPVVVLVVVLISISVPVRMAWQALMELLNRTPSAQIVEDVRKIISESTSALPVEQLFVRVIQPGRTRMVLVYVVLPSDYAPGPLTSLDALRMSTLERLREAHLATVLDMVFTADEKWGAPLNESSQSLV